MKEISNILHRMVFYDLWPEVIEMKYMTYGLYDIWII